MRESVTRTDSTWSNEPCCVAYRHDASSQHFVCKLVQVGVGEHRISLSLPLHNTQNKTERRPARPVKKKKTQRKKWNSVNLTERSDLKTSEIALLPKQLHWRDCLCRRDTRERGGREREKSEYYYWKLVGNQSIITDFIIPFFRVYIKQETHESVQRLSGWTTCHGTALHWLEINSYCRPRHDHIGQTAV